MQWSDYFYYDETSPTCLRWKVDVLGGKQQSSVIMRKGDVAGGLRFDTEGKRTTCAVKIQYRVRHIHRIIWEMLYGSIPRGKEIDHLDGNPHNNVFTNLRCKTKGGNARNRKKRKDNSTGITGVSFSSKSNKESYVASWVDSEGKYRNCRFSVLKYGKEEAFRLACEKRAEKIQQLNSELGDEAYTERHGKE